MYGEESFVFWSAVQASKMRLAEGYWPSLDCRRERATSVDYSDEYNDDFLPVNHD